MARILQLRASSEISGGRIILNVDCDMYSSDSQSVRDALCCFMDERKGDEIAFVQFSLKFSNVGMNDLYANSLTITMEVGTEIRESNFFLSNWISIYIYIDIYIYIE